MYGQILLILQTALLQLGRENLNIAASHPPPNSLEKASVLGVYELCRKPIRGFWSEVTSYLTVTQDLAASALPNQLLVVRKHSPSWLSRVGSAVDHLIACCSLGPELWR